MKKYLLTLLVISLALSACAAQESSTSLLGSWNLTAYGSTDSPTTAVREAGAQITFNEDGTVVGNSGCNGFGGEYKVEANQITFGQITSTLMACDAPIMMQEDAAKQVMTGTATYKIEGDTLTITNKDNVLVLVRGTLSTQEPESAPLIGAWKLISYGATDTISSALADVEAGLTFNEDGTITGTSGCNEFGGNYMVDGNEIDLDEIVSTLMLCDAPVMDQEEAMHQVLAEKVAFQIEGNTLTIMKNGKVLVFTH
jgi:heat shock protein HslJ